MSEQKQLELKHKHRDKLVQLGARAIEHALRFNPDEATRRIVRERLDRIRNGNVETAAEIVREHDQKVKQIGRCLRYSKENNFLRATVELFRLATTEKHATDTLLNAVLIPCWDAGIFLSQAALQNEMKWQNEAIYPKVEQAFRELWAAKDALKKKCESQCGSEQCELPLGHKGKHRDQGVSWSDAGAARVNAE